MNAANSFAIDLIRGYQRRISPFLGNRCRFHPTCSQYAVDCFENYSFGRAFVKSAYRILRCQPFSSGYFDPAVPEKHSH